MADDARIDANVSNSVDSVADEVLANMGQLFDGGGEGSGILPVDVTYPLQSRFVTAIVRVVDQARVEQGDDCFARYRGCNSPAQHFLQVQVGDDFRVEGT